MNSRVPLHYCGYHVSFLFLAKVRRYLYLRGDRKRRFSVYGRPNRRNKRCVFKFTEIWVRFELKTVILMISDWSFVKGLFFSYVRNNQSETIQISVKLHQYVWVDSQTQHGTGKELIERRGRAGPLYSGYWPSYLHFFRWPKCNTTQIKTSSNKHDTTKQ